MNIIINSLVLKITGDIKYKVKKLIVAYPIISFILITFLITFGFWSISVFFPLAKDINLALQLLGATGPSMAGLFIIMVRSGARLTIGNKRLFIQFFLMISLALLLPLWLRDQGYGRAQNFAPSLSEVSLLGWLLFIFLVTILSANIAHATNPKLQENHIRSFLFSKSSLKWYLVAIFLIPGLFGATALLSFISGMEMEQPAFNPDPLFIIGFFSTFFYYGGNEEFGFRGFLQKEVQKRYSPLLAVFFISIIWSFWHLPLYYNGFYSTDGFIAFLPRLILQLPTTIIYTWLFNKSGYSVLALAIIHAMKNNSETLLSGGSPVIASILFVGLLIYFIINGKMWKKQDFSHFYEDHENDVQTSYAIKN